MRDRFLYWLADVVGVLDALASKDDVIDLMRKEVIELRRVADDPWDRLELAFRIAHLEAQLLASAERPEKTCLFCEVEEPVPERKAAVTVAAAKTALFATEQLLSMARADLARLAPVEFAKGLERAAQFIDAVAEGFVHANSTWDPETGALELKPHQDDHVYTLTDIAEGIRQLPHKMG